MKKNLNFNYVLWLHSKWNILNVQQITFKWNILNVQQRLKCRPSISFNGKQVTDDFLGSHVVNILNESYSIFIINKTYVSMLFHIYHILIIMLQHFSSFWNRSDQLIILLACMNLYFRPEQRKWRESCIARDVIWPSDDFKSGELV